MAYLNLMLDNKANFIFEYNESSHLSHNLKREGVDWSQSRVIFISPEFTKYQQHAIGSKISIVLFLSDHLLATFLEQSSKQLMK